jgi:hypothetical protein
MNLQVSWSRVAGILSCGTKSRRRRGGVHGFASEVLQERRNLDATVGGMISQSIEATSTQYQSTTVSTPESSVVAYGGPQSPNTPVYAPPPMIGSQLMPTTPMTPPSTTTPPVVSTTPPTASGASINSITVSLNADGSARVSVTVNNFITGLSIQFGGVLNGYSVAAVNGGPSTLTVQGYESGFASAQLMHLGSMIGTASGFYIGTI